MSIRRDDDGPRVAIVTGASQGLGASIAAAYRGLGYAVVGTSRSIARSDDPQFATVQGDVAVAGTAERVVDEAIRRFGRVDTLVNNAGVYRSKRFTDYTDADYELLAGVNLAGLFRMTRRAIEQMEPRRSGHVVNITTTIVERADARVPAGLVALTKGGVAAVTRSLAIEYAATGIRVNAVSPGVVRTAPDAADADDGLAEQHPLGRVGEMSDVVAAILYLESAPFVTGEVLHVDGGQSAGH